MQDKALKPLSPRLWEGRGTGPPKVGPRPREAFPRARALWLGVRGTGSRLDGDADDGLVRRDRADQASLATVEVDFVQA